MPLSAPPQTLPYAIIDQRSVAPDWDGARLVLSPDQNANMPQTVNGTMVFTYENMSAKNNQGAISLTSGGGSPNFYTVAAGANQPSFLMDNWKANNLSITNISPNTETPIAIQAIGPGLPGITPLPIAVGPPGRTLAPGQTGQSVAAPQWMQLVLQCNAATTAVVALIGGPPDAQGQNGHVFAVNYPTDSGPGTGVAPPAGYYATTTANTYTFQFNWGGSALFLANLSSTNAYAVTIILRPL
ncbi:MAG TPA: hypothetical protein VL752_02315 [Acidisoma sp.]|uniref:hypothetical protein n=1 Tax=Acidisoma sp. TaxID=1872115 RepID=UPI002BD648E0|nr:hypothetical protein [Acidisoma sp.]HTH99755.1 hypothetical protein [Acidisoma sp.]